MKRDDEHTDQPPISLKCNDRKIVWTAYTTDMFEGVDMRPLRPLGEVATFDHLRPERNYEAH